LDFIKNEYSKTPLDLNITIPPNSLGLVLERIEADELWSFVGKKKRQVWIWLVLDALTRQVITMHAGGRGETDAKAFWEEVPEPYRSGCDVYTDEWDAYKKAIPEEAHFAVKKKSGKTSLIEGVNCILRQRISRLVRKTVSFSKTLANHIGAIRYFLSYYNRWAYEEFLDRFDIIGYVIT